ncbi:hypothetical protein [Spirosoma pollinicola]|uniref:Lipoprotein n=1 Tax=Spirosoma pollinicola TaxID=2057025 RepID=A0A2K8Z2M6_9BACT|nr:hypothetical protein [Spirosoma pollinicola]AUD04123.1 hypothetical protein CWM47_21185 [Spirosoma pollinicola]
MNTKLPLILLILGSTQTMAPSLSANQTDREYCPHAKRLSYMHPTDSTRRQVVLDSVNRLLVGQWQLIDIGNKTYKVMPTPEDSITLSVDGQGKSVVYEKGKQLIDFQLASGINFNNLRCVISEAGRAYFHLRASRPSKGEEELSQQQVFYPNGLRVCEDYLELYAYTSAGPYYVFKRLTSVR